jgi:hypothetical protein
MSASPKPSLKPRLDSKRSSNRFNPLGGAKLSTYSLLRAVYMDKAKEAEAILKADAGQINLGDPFAGVTPLHVAIFRQNENVVKLLVEHPRCDVWQKDNFGRTPIDMLVYNSNRTIFEMVMKRAYPGEDRVWADSDSGTAQISLYRPRIT